jgi:hypothetical protein
MILFLDFDGVLHPESNEGDDCLFCHTPLLWQILRTCLHVDVVFSTSWRHMHPFDELIQLCTTGGGEDLVHRFIGATPWLTAEETALYCGRQKYHREIECRLWLDTNAPQSTWLALDDFAAYFTPFSASVHITNQQTGLTETDMLQVIAKCAP